MQIGFFWAAASDRYGFFLNSARPDGLQTLPEMAWVHACRGADGAEIAVVVKKKFFRDAAVSQRPADPLFQSFRNNCTPQFFFCRTLILLMNRAFKHCY